MRVKIPLHEYWQLLRRYLAPQRGAVFLMAGLLLTSIGLQLIGPQVVRSFIDAARAGASTAVLMQTALLFLGIAIVQQAMNVLANYWGERVAWTATNALRADLTAHLLRLDLGFHKRHTPGELIERVDGDVNALAGFFSSFMVQLIGSALFLIGVLVAIYLIDVRLGLAFSVFVGLTLVLLTWVWRRGTPHWQADRGQSATHYGYVGEVLAATEDIRSSGAVDYALRRFFEHLRGWLPVGMRAGLWGQAVMMAAIVAFAVGEAIAYGLGGSLYRSDAISLGAVYLIIAYMAMLAAPIETIRTQLQDLQQADASIVRVRELLDIHSELADGSSHLPGGALAVEFCGVHFAYDEQTNTKSSENDLLPLAPLVLSEVEGCSLPHSVLDHISFHLQPGKVLGLLGHTGSGKTTITRLLFRLYDPQQGKVCLGGVDVRDVRLADLRARVGLVTQDVQLFEASLRDNLTFFDPTIADSHLLAVLERLGLRLWLTRLPQGLYTSVAASTLSAGEAQLIALARVFLKDPGLVILDEASSRLDPATEALLDQALDALLAGRTAIIIAHRLATVERVDDILILENGRIQEQGSRHRLAADLTSRYHQLRQLGLQELLQ